MEMKELYVLWLKPGEDESIELHEYVEQVRETKCGYKAAHPESSPFKSYLFKSEKLNCLIRKGAEGLIMYGFDQEELVRTYAGAILPNGCVISGGVLSKGKPEYDENSVFEVPVSHRNNARNTQNARNSRHSKANSSGHDLLSALMNKSNDQGRNISDGGQCEFFPEDFDECSDCALCGEAVPLSDIIIVNYGFPDQRSECIICNAANLEMDTEIHCEACDSYFDKTHMNNGKCPYCDAKILQRTADETKANEPVVLPATGDILVYTDGACIGNPGPGGWAAILRCGGVEKILTGGDTDTTNNRMELMGSIAALQSLDGRRTVTIVSDSKYVVDAINKGWARNWMQNRWVKGDGSPAKNADLWAKLMGLIKQHDVTFRWVRGHNGDALNERCDQLSVQMANQYSH